MKTVDIVARFDNRPGFDIATYQEVFLPLIELNTTVVILENKPITPLEEYELKAIDAGFNNPTDISGFLGIEHKLIVKSMSELQREGAIREDSDGVIGLTVKGKTVLKELVSIRPKEVRYEFLFDAVTRCPRRIAVSDQYRPKETVSEGLRKIPGFPQRAPTPEEIDRKSLVGYLREANKGEENFQLLDVKRVNKTKRLFEKAIMLVYKSEKTDDVPVSFLIDGRPSPAHDSAFQKNKGLERLGIDKESIQGNDVLDYLHGLGSKGDEIVSAVDSSRNEVQPLLKEISETRDLSERSKRQASITADPRVRNNLESEIQVTTEKISLAKRQLSEVPIRRLQVYEHPEVLQSAIQSAMERLVIISPWITPAVVDDQFISDLGKCLEKRVNVFIGYGLGNKNHPFGQDKAVKRLRNIANRYPELFVLKELGDTHAKILIKDSDFYVITSFNWLSFKGDPAKQFREEWGVYISDQVEVDEFFSTLGQRFRST